MVASMAKNPLSFGYKPLKNFGFGQISSSGGNGKRKKRSGAGRVAKGVVSAAITVHGAATQLPHGSYEPLGNEARSAAQNESSDRARSQRGASRDRGRGSNGSSGKS
jgi:hypothetical protein